MYAHIFPLLAFLDVLFTVLSCLLLNWWAPLFANEEGWLPNWLAWVQTFDDTLDTGIRDLNYPASNHWERYWSRVRWLYRNPGYGFSYWALGCAFNPADWTVHLCDETGDNFYATCADGRFCHKWIENGWRYKTGWKAANLYDSVNKKWKVVPWGPEWRIPIVFSISKV